MRHETEKHDFLIANGQSPHVGGAPKWENEKMRKTSALLSPSPVSLQWNWCFVSGLKIWFAVIACDWVMIDKDGWLTGTPAEDF